MVLDSGRGNGVGEGLRSFLRKIVTDAAFDDPMLVWPGEFPGICAGVRMRRTIGITFESDGGNSNDRTFGQTLFQRVVFRLTFRQTEPPAVIVNDDADMIGIVEGLGGARERGLVEVPL